MSFFAAASFSAILAWMGVAVVANETSAGRLKVSIALRSAALNLKLSSTDLAPFVAVWLPIASVALRRSSTLPLTAAT